MNAIFSGCILDPWLDVAKELNYKHNIKPVYWLSWNNHGEESVIKDEFKNIVFHDFRDAWFGRFPISISMSYPTIGQLKTIAKEELIGIRMMDRQDHDRYSFNFDERQRHFRDLLAMWQSIINEYEIDYFISASVPHRVFDYTLYLMCKLNGIKTIMYKITAESDLIIPTYDVDELPTRIKEFYKYYKTYPQKITLDDNSSKFFNKIKADTYEKGMPASNKTLEAKEKKIRKNRLKKFLFLEIKISKVLKNLLFEVNKRSKLYYKLRNVEIKNSSYSNKIAKHILKKGRRNLNSLRKYYSLISEEPSFNNNYIYVALHYQPEETSTPSGGYYTDQILLVEHLANALPSNHYLYVKEHIHQFSPLREGFTSRDKAFYNRIKSIPKVKIISLAYDSFKLIDNAAAVATITGTVGWEALNRGKKVIVFGNAWYQYHDNVIFVKDFNDLERFLSNIGISDTVPDNKDEIINHKAYWMALQEFGLRGYHYPGFKKRTSKEKKEVVNSLIETIIKAD